MKRQDVQKLIKLIESVCAQNGLRFTEPRRQVLEIIAASDKPMGAYDILAELGSYIDNPKPPTAYRAIEFLAGQGFIHKIESLNAFVVCATDHRHHGSQFLVCDDCGKVIEAHLCHLPDELDRAAKSEGFALTRWNAELHGKCKDCQKA